ncbi:MAG: hypothetical protein JWN74_205 [Acidobacteriaceae bacterium]|nr:hypothetical protein [Acidobacteriaceae bacterium]
MSKREVCVFAVVLFQSCLLYSQSNDRNPPVFYFGGEQFYVGMSKRDAAMALSSCCRLSPPAESEVEKRPSPAGKMVGHFVLPKEESTQAILGVIYFSEGKVVRISRALADNVDTFNEDLVAFMRAVKRSLPEGETSAAISVKHERVSNAESDVVTFVFANGQGLEFHIGTLDTPNDSNRRDFVTLDETLEPVR